MRPWAVWLGLGLGCRSVDPVDETPVEVVRPERIVLVVVDTLRADHLGTYGYPRPTSPALDAWASQATVFTEARAAAPWTLPSMRALMGADRIRDFDPDDTLATRLDAAGWRTVLLTANYNLSPEFGFASGWDRAELQHGSSASDQVDRALAELSGSLEEADAGHFVLLHLMDPHLPYTEGPEEQGVFAGSPPTPRLATEPIMEPKLRADNALRPLTTEELDYLVDRYDQNVLAVDRALARLREAIGPEDLLIVTSDHGESLGELGQYGHGHHLTEELVHVPLLIAGLGWTPGRRDEPVGLDDVGATVLAAAGLPLPEDARGRDLRKPLSAARAQLLSHTHYGPSRIGLVDGTSKWIAQGAQLEVADLTEDPGWTAPGVEAWSEPRRQQWLAAGGEPLVPAIQVVVEPAALHETGDAPTDLRKVELRASRGIQRVWWPPAPLRVGVPSVSMDGPLATLEADGPFALPRELHVELEALGLDGEILEVVVERGGNRVEGEDLTGLSVVPAWVPPPSAHLPLDPRGADAGDGLKALGYVDD